MKVFISHKKEDATTAAQIAAELKKLKVDYYLDLLDPSITLNGKALTDHIKANLNQCTDIIVVMSGLTVYSQWVPFEVGMSAQVNMPTATYLKADAALPEFLSYWPRLKQLGDIEKYVTVRKRIELKALLHYGTFERASLHKEQEVSDFYAALKQELR